MDNGFWTINNPTSRWIQDNWNCDLEDIESDYPKCFVLETRPVHTLQVSNQDMTHDRSN
jgi:hypothetical protein